MIRQAAAALAAALGLALFGCGSMESAKVDYKAEKKLPPLELPPDLTAPPRDDRFQIPDTAGKPAGPTTLSAYDAERKAGPKPGTTSVLPDFDKVKIERTASERWLVVPEPPEKVWPVVKSFWQDMGFLIKLENPETGVMETDWAENRAKIKEDPLRNAITGFLSGGNSTGERDKFRTRLERGAVPNTTEIYVSHRGVTEVYVNQYRDSTVWQARPADPGLEAEFLRLMMARFGVDEARAKALLAVKPEDPKAKLVAGNNGSSGSIELADPFDRAWRRVGLVLDRAGFTVEDRDRSKGFYFVRYVDPEDDAVDKANDSFLAKLMFWRDPPDPKAGQYRVFVKEGSGDSSEVRVLNKDGAADSSDTAKRILSLLQQQLK
jgi:outer membrane protein assembly factor BamC